MMSDKIQHPSQTMTDAEYKAAFKARALQTMKDFPLIPIAVLGTLTCFIMAGVKMRQGDPRKFNYWLRGRVIMQGIAIGAVVWALRGDGVAFAEKEKKAMEREAFEKRMAMAEEAHRIEVEETNAKERKRSWWPWGS